LCLSSLRTVDSDYGPDGASIGTMSKNSDGRYQYCT
jgi:hypothetical protein